MMQKKEKSAKKHVLTNKQAAQHLFAGRKILQLQRKINKVFL